MRSYRHIAAWAAFLWILHRPATLAAPLSPGDVAPSLVALTNWVQAAWTAGERSDPPAITVLEFWEPGIPPCRQTSPYISKLYKELSGKGVRFAGITRAPAKDVKAFLQTTATTHPIALDPDGALSGIWLEGSESLPIVFVVDKQGKVAWIGHPLDSLQEVIRGLLDGTYDVGRAQAARTLHEALLAATREGDSAKALDICEQLINAFPQRIEYHQLRANLLIEAGDFQALAAHHARMMDLFADAPEHLNTLAWMIAGPSSLPYARRDLRLALTAALRADKLTEHKDAAILDTLATIYQMTGKLDEALAAAEAAVARAPDGATRADYTVSRDFIRNLVALRDGKPDPAKGPAPQVRPPAPAVTTGTPATATNRTEAAEPAPVPAPPAEKNIPAAAGATLPAES